jgi:hypothetical protein
MHVWYDINALNWTVDLAGEAPDAVLLISNPRLIFGIIPPYYVYKTCFDAGFAAGAFFQIDFNVGTHAASKTELVFSLLSTKHLTNPSVEITGDLAICKMNLFYVS